jgi:hypothetical protein
LALFIVSKFCSKATSDIFCVLAFLIISCSFWDYHVLILLAVQRAMQMAVLSWLLGITYPSEDHGNLFSPMKGYSRSNGVAESLSQWEPMSVDCAEWSLMEQQSWPKR